MLKAPVRNTPVGTSTVHGVVGEAAAAACSVAFRNAAVLSVRLSPTAPKSCTLKTMEDEVKEELYAAAPAIGVEAVKKAMAVAIAAAPTTRPGWFMMQPEPAARARGEMVNWQTWTHWLLFTIRPKKAGVACVVWRSSLN